MNYHISIQHGEKQKIVDRGSEAIWGAGDVLLLTVIPQIAITCILIIMGLFVNIWMTLLSLVLLPFGIIGVFYINKKGEKYQDEANIYFDKFYGRLSDAFTNLNVIRIFGRTQTEVRVLSERFNAASNEQNKVRKIWV
jgi:ABC-type multidrug transport system fused ATPase/permease subunit